MIKNQGLTFNLHISVIYPHFRLYFKLAIFPPLL